MSVKKISSRAKAKFGLVAGAVVAGSTSAMADTTIALPSVSVDDILAWAAIILIGIAAIWPIKKLIALGNKS